MTQIVLDAELRQKLGNLTELVEVVNEQGQVLATVLPTTDSALYRQVECPHDDAEIQRRLASNLPRYSLQQMLDHLRKL